MTFLTAASGRSSFVIVPGGSTAAGKEGSLPLSVKAASIPCAATRRCLQTASHASPTAARIQCIPAWRMLLASDASRGTAKVMIPELSKPPVPSSTSLFANGNHSLPRR